MNLWDRFPSASPSERDSLTDFGEPDIASDGATLRLLEDPEGDLYVRIQEPGEPGSSNFCYPRDYVLKLGDGSFYRGAARIGRSHLALAPKPGTTEQN